MFLFIYRALCFIDTVVEEWGDIRMHCCVDTLDDNAALLM